MAKDIQKRIAELSTQLHEHNYKYYVENKPTISDYDFDRLLRELIDLEEQHPEFRLEDSPTQRVGSDLSKGFETIEHEAQMLSLSNTYSEQEVIEFDERVQKGLESTQYEYNCELKIDGLAMSLVYEKGVLKYAATRGDGKKGDVVTNNIKTIPTIPIRLRGKNIPDYVEIRGEVYISKTTFQKLNQVRVQAGEEPYANPRNLASGTIKLLDPKEVAARKLEFFPYFVRLRDNAQVNIKTQFESFSWLNEWGFKTNPEVKVCKNLTEVMDYIRHWDSQRHNLAYETDGIVVKINQYQQQDILGYTSKFPRWAFAYKYPAQAAETILEEISFQVGRTGVITPVANVKPVTLAGTVVKRATLHNAQEIKRLDLRIGDTVYMEKGGEIIPKITGVNLSKRDKKAQPFAFLTHCPECNTALQLSNTGIQYYCPNIYQCPPQVVGKVVHYVSRKAMDIQAIGEETVEQLYKAGLVNDIADLYSLKLEEVLKLDRFAKKSAQNVIDGVEKSKQKPFEVVLYALGIRYVGETVSTKLTRHFKNIDALFAATPEALTQIEEIGEKIAEAIAEAAQNAYYQSVIKRLRAAGVCFELDESTIAQPASNLLAGLTLLATGTFKHFSRDGIEKAIQDNGGKLVSSVSKKLSFLIVGEEAGGSKLQKAQENNVKMITEEEFMAMINPTT